MEPIAFLGYAPCICMLWYHALLQVMCVERMFDRWVGLFGKNRIQKNKPILFGLFYSVFVLFVLYLVVILRKPIFHKTNETDPIKLEKTNTQPIVDATLAKTASKQSRELFCHLVVEGIDIPSFAVDGYKLYLTYI